MRRPRSTRCGPGGDDALLCAMLGVAPGSGSVVEGVDNRMVDQ